MGKVGFKRLSSEAIIPTKAHDTDSGFDLYAAEDVIIEPGETKVVPTGIAVLLPAGMEAQVRPRSGITSKTKLRVQLGTIDNGYTGDIGIIVDNISPVNSGIYKSHYLGIDAKAIKDPKPTKDNTDVFTYLIRKGDKLAQLIVQHLPQVEAEEIEYLTKTERGIKGYGSSGVN